MHFVRFADERDYRKKRGKCKFRRTYFAFLEILYIVGPLFYILYFMKTALQARSGTVLRVDGELFIVVKHEMKRGGR